MIAKGISTEQLRTAAAAIDVSVEITTLNASGTRHRVKVNPGVERRRYGRIAAASGRRVHAVCWHGFRDFFRACFEHEPEAVFQTAFDTWRGSTDFEARYRESGHRNIGSQMMPMYACEACTCPDSGEAR
jgi:hypothetical protein